MFSSVALAFALAQQPVKINAGTLNVRSGPGTSNPVIGTIPQGQLYVAVGASGSWRQIWYGPGKGWVCGSYVSNVSATIGKVTATSLNVRAGPGTSYSAVGQAPQGSWWVIAGSSGDWRKIYFGGAARWVHGAYLNGTPPPPPTSSAGFIQLPASGTGFYCYSPPDRRWGKPTMVYGLMTVASTWDAQHDWPRIGVGDISLQNGGPISGHVSHQLGRDVDLRPVRKDAVEGTTTITSSSYSSARTKDLITHHLKVHLTITVIFFNDAAIDGALGYVQNWPNHDNHLHVRIP